MKHENYCLHLLLDENALFHKHVLKKSMRNLIRNLCIFLGHWKSIFLFYIFPSKADITF